MYNKIGGKFVPKGKGPFLMKGFSGFGDESPVKHDDKELTKSLDQKRAEYEKQRERLSKPFGMSPEQSNRTRSMFGMKPVFETASNYMESIKNFFKAPGVGPR